MSTTTRYEFCFLLTLSCASVLFLMRVLSKFYLCIALHKVVVLLFSCQFVFLLGLSQRADNFCFSQKKRTLCTLVQNVNGIVLCLDLLYVLCISLNIKKASPSVAPLQGRPVFAP